MDKEIRFDKRDAKNKGEAKRLRRAGKVPAVFYSQNDTSENVAIATEDFQEVLRNLKPGFLPTTIFKLVDTSGKERRAIIKDIQYNVTNYNVIHLDFQELDETKKVSLNVPIQCINQVDCVGVKAGGFVRAIMRHLKVLCLPKDIPTHFDVDVKDLGMNQIKKVKDMTIPSQVRSLGREDDTVVTIVKR